MVTSPELSVKHLLSFEAYLMKHNQVCTKDNGSNIYQLIWGKMKINILLY